MGNITSAKAAMNYQTASQRPSCRNCAHSEELGHSAEGGGWRCKKGGFYTTVQAICSQHQRAPGKGATHA